MPCHSTKRTCHITQCRLTTTTLFGTSHCQTVKESDLETLSPSDRPTTPHGKIVAMHDGPPDDPNAADSAITEYDVEDAEHLQVLTLPESAVNGSRKVPGVCAICLCAYEVGDVVAWSLEASCQHAFHKDCLVPWLAKKSEPHCPVCRQSFCKVTYPESESIFDAPFTFSQSFSQALARARLEASLMSRMESGDSAPAANDLELAAVPLEDTNAHPAASSSGVDVIDPLRLPDPPQEAVATASSVPASNDASSSDRLNLNDQHGTENNASQERNS
jgi:hypothetical protein